MLPKLSLVVKLSSLFTLITILALVSMGYSLLVTQITEGDAAAINVSGSLRMQSHRMASRLQQPQLRSQLPALAIEFENSLYSKTLADVVPDNSKHSTYRQYHLVLDTWIRLKPMILGQQPKQFLNEVDEFVNHIDVLVREFQHNSEIKIQRLRQVQAIVISLTIIISVLLIYVLRQNIVMPLKQLTVAAEQLRLGNFSTQVGYHSKDELGLLSETFDNMAQDLSELYGDLETKVMDKTKEIQRTNRTLELLYNASRTFSRHPDQVLVLVPSILQQLADATRVRKIRFFSQDDLKDDIPSVRYYLSALERAGVNAKGPVDVMDNDQSLFPVRFKEHLLGLVACSNPIHFEDWQIQVINTMTDIIANAILLADHAANEARVALASERAIIARELHDSIAQNLSYLKIQLTRLRLRLREPYDAQDVEALLQEFSDALNSSYKQLRELITTFRLKTEAQELHQALQTTIEEFNQYSSTDFQLYYDLKNQLAPNEEVHVLHIIRECMSNVIKHAKASHCRVLLQNQQDQVEVTIADDGVGLGQDARKPGHYGLNILQERAQRLRGDISFATPTQGTTVILTFTPQTTPAAAG
ncbi:histidine kinase [Gynuella sunshinyii]|uniref:histidine kinase n=1 Tax=Gynuella sunshinyii TaxID=1445505 RepID=UPI0014704F2D|nr:histidine kinase [Gynuella sunshinyii]